jgi:hypothetical protein
VGWTFYHRDNGETNLEHFRAKFTNYELLDGMTVGGTFYGALRDPEDGSVTAVVFLTRRVPRDYYNFGYKDMDEAMGPNEARCPERILALLTEAPNEYAHEWRNRCHEYNERIAKVKRGSVIEHAGSRYVAVDLRRNLFRSEDGRLLRWSWWRSTNDLQVVA